MPDHWRTVFLRELFEETNSRKGEVSDAFPVLSVLKTGSIVRSEDYFNRSVASRDTSKYKVVEPDWWAYSTIHINEGSIAPNRLGFAGVVSPMYTTMRWNSSSDDSEFWSLRLLSTEMINQYDSFASGTVNRRKSLKFKKFADISVAVPPLDEQRRIVDLVGSIDTYIDSLETQIETTRTARSALLSELLSNPGDDWQETTLGEVGEVNPKEAPLAEDAPFVPMDAVNVGQRWVEYTEPRGTRSGARARAGDVLFARITPCLENGKTAQVQNEIDRCGGSTEFIVLRGSERVDADFLYFWATDRNVRERAANLMTGSTGRQRLSPKDLASMTLSVPPLDEQRRIVDLVGSLDEQISLLESQVESVRALRSGVLSELLSGERLLDESYDLAVGI